MAGILGPDGFTYKEKLVTLDILPLSLYQEIHVILLLARIMNGKIDIDWTKHMSRLDYGGTRKSQTGNFAARTLRLKKCKFDFWFRDCQQANPFNDYFEEDFPIPNHKIKPLEVETAFFRQIDREMNPCTWRLFCDCSVCKETKKLKKLEIPLH